MGSKIPTIKTAMAKPIAPCEVIALVEAQSFFKVSNMVFTTEHYLYSVIIYISSIHKVYDMRLKHGQFNNTV